MCHINGTTLFILHYKKSFHLCIMEGKDFVSLDGLKKCIMNRKKTTCDNKVEWLKKKWIQVQKDEPMQFRFRYSHNDMRPWKTVDLKKKTAC